MTYQIDWIDGEAASRKRANNAERQRRFRAKKRQEGLISVTGMVHVSQVPEILALFRLLEKNPDLVVGMVRDTATGRYRKVR